MLRPSMRGGVPVFSRPTANPRSRSLRASAFGGRVPGATPLVVPEPHVDASAEEGADGHHHARGLDAHPDPGHHPAHRIPVHEEIGDGLLEQREPGRAFEHPAHVAAVQRTVDLGAGRAHRGTLARVQGAEVDPAVVRGQRHRPAEGVDFLDEVPLPIPPMAGLQLICPSVSMLWVSSSVCAPARAAASAASVPAWPPPTTITSNVRG